jgi:hypothetical protein
MGTDDAPLVFEQIHIEVARNATDDFNPFHDKLRWQHIRGNPFGGAIALGFQLECLLEYRIRQRREAHDEQALIDRHGLRYSNYQINFANAVRCGQRIDVDIKPSQLKEGENTTLSNRVALKADGRLALMGFKRESRQALVLPDCDLGPLGDLANHDTKGYLPGTSWFLAHKFVMNANAKNFLSGSLVEQSDYIDELDNRVQFPEIYPCSLISCVLLEKGVYDGLDFLANPMVYAAHRISVDRQLLASLRSNDPLHLLSRRVPSDEDAHSYECYGLVGDHGILFRAEISLVPLDSILKQG